MSSLLALTMRMGISSCSRSLRQIVFVSVDVNGIFSFGEENKILLWGQEGNQPPAGEIFRMFQIAVKKDMAGNFGGTRALGYIFQIQIIIAAAQGWGAGRHNGGDDDSHENRHDKHDEVRNQQPADAQSGKTTRSLREIVSLSPMAVRNLEFFEKMAQISSSLWNKISKSF